MQGEEGTSQTQLSEEPTGQRRHGSAPTEYGERVGISPDLYDKGCLAL